VIAETQPASLPELAAATGRTPGAARSGLSGCAARNEPVLIGRRAEAQGGQAAGNCLIVNMVYIVYN
jgi:hypothetical protein